VPIFAVRDDNDNGAAASQHSALAVLQDALVRLVEGAAKVGSGTGLHRQHCVQQAVRGGHGLVLKHHLHCQQGGM
jgi:hypothetical protein